VQTAGLFFFMDKLHRLIPSWPFPSYIFIPGENPHPKKSGGHMEGQGDPKTEPLDLIHPEKSEFFKFALDLLNYGYYWESHVYFEALWNAHGRTGEVADLLKAFIKLGAAGVKLQIKQPERAREHLERARELFESVRVRSSDRFLGFDLTALSKIDHLRPIYPAWASQV
jgi:hypothetical protein